MVSSHPSRKDAIVRATSEEKESRRYCNELDASDTQSDDLSAEMRNLEQEVEEDEMDFDNCEISCKAPSARLSGRTIEKRHLSGSVDCGAARFDSRHERFHENDEHRQEKGSSRYTSQHSSYFRDPPPPPPPPPQHNRNEDYECAKSSLSKKISTTSKSPQEKALVTLLKEMRSMEQKLETSNQNHAKERAALMDALTQQSNYIETLEKDLKRKSSAFDEFQKSQKSALAKIFSQLNKFADGCSKFPSASVKKMSDALKYQVGEWAKAFKISVNDSCDEHDHDQEESTMTKIQALHLEIRELRQANQTLRENMRKFGSEFGCGGSVMSKSSVNYINATEHSDEVSNFSGMTSTTKLMDAMTGFLNEYERRAIPPQVPGEKSKNLQSSGVSVASKPSTSLDQQGGSSQRRSNPPKSTHRPVRSQSPQFASSLRQHDQSKRTNSNTASSPPNSTSNTQTTANDDNRKSRPKKTVQMNITPQILCDKPRDDNENTNAGHDERHHDGSLKISGHNRRKLQKPRPILTSGFEACNHYSYNENWNYEFEDGESEV